MLFLSATATLGKLVPAVVLGTTSVRFALSGLAEITAASAWTDAAGIAGLVLCALALYAAAALALEDGRHRTVLPLWRRSGLDDGSSPIEREAGVREQL